MLAHVISKSKSRNSRERIQITLRVAVAVVSQFVKDIGPKCITQIEFSKNSQEVS